MISPFLPRKRGDPHHRAGICLVNEAFLFVALLFTELVSTRARGEVASAVDIPPNCCKLGAMKTSSFAVNLSIAAATVILAGCGNSKSTSTSGEPSTPALPKTQEALATTADQTKKAVTDAASAATESVKAAASDAGSKLLDIVKTQSDSVLTSLGQDLAAKAKSLVASSPGNESVSTNVNTALTALANNQDNQALAPAFQLSQGIGLTPQQTQLAKEVGNLASAFVVQRNFSSLAGAQGDVGTLVNALRQGQYTAALPPLQKIMNNASLTPGQKDLLGSLADKYAPSLKQAAGTLGQGLQKLQGIPGVSK